jgi:hypothetical protein
MVDRSEGQRPRPTPGQPGPPPVGPTGTAGPASGARHASPDAPTERALPLDALRQVQPRPARPPRAAGSSLPPPGALPPAPGPARPVPGPVQPTPGPALPEPGPTAPGAPQPSRPRFWQWGASRQAPNDQPPDEVPPAAGPAPQPSRPRRSDRPPPPRPRARWTLGLALTGLGLVLACFLILPWARVGGEWITVPDIWNADGIPPVYLLGGWLVILWPAGLVTFGGTLDSAGSRALFALTCLLASSAVAAVVVAYPRELTVAFGQVADAVAPGGRLPTSPVALLIVVACGGVLFGAGYLASRGLTCRIISGVLLLFAALGHSIGAQGVLSGVESSFEAGAYAATFGYLLCAVAAFGGPAYEQPVTPDAAATGPASEQPPAADPPPSGPATESESEHRPAPSTPHTPPRAPAPPRPPAPPVESQAAKHPPLRAHRARSHRRQPRHVHATFRALRRAPSGW